MEAVSPSTVLFRVMMYTPPPPHNLVFECNIVSCQPSLTTTPIALMVQMLASEAEPVKEMSVGEMQKDADFLIKPTKVVAPLDTSQWPILLKNYDR